MAKMEKEFIIELTNACNNACLHCSSECQGQTDSPTSLDVYMLRNLVPVLRDNGFTTIIYSGGEPFLYPAIIELTEFFKSHGFIVKVYTSGNFGHLFDNAFLQLFETAIFSVHSHNEKIHNHICNNDKCYSKMSRNLKHMRSLGVRIETNLVPMAMNVHDIIDTYLFFADSIARFNVLKLVKQGNAKTHWDEISSSYFFLRKSLSKLKGFQKIKLGNSFCDLSNSTHYCDAGKNKVCLTYDGYLIPCEIFKSRRKEFPCFSQAIIPTWFQKFRYANNDESFRHRCNALDIHQNLQSEFSEIM